jgi:hypothetical protein
MAMHRATYVYISGFPPEGGWEDKFPPQMIQGGISPLNLSFFGNCFPGFENLITLSVILRHLEA